MPIRSFDHVAIPIQNTEAMLSFYRALGFGVKEREHFYSVHFGDHKINFHAPERWQSGRFTLRGPTAVPGVAIFVSSGRVRRSRCTPPSIKPGRK